MIEKAGIPNLSKLVTKKDSEKQSAYNERAQMLHLAAVQVGDSASKFDLHYKVYGHAVCRHAYMYFHAISDRYRIVLFAFFE